MKIALGSDIHLEFGSYNIRNTKNAEVLILSGDIFVARTIADTSNLSGHMNRDFVEQACKEFEHVIYIMGNHEHYHGDFNKSEGLIRSVTNHLSNFHFLEKQTLTIKDITFVGGTLWTNFNNNDVMTKVAVERGMNDFHSVVAGELGFTSEMAYHDHLLMFDFITKTVENDPKGKFVVVTHHSPSRQSTHPRYQNQYQLNGGYSSEYDDFIVNHPQIKVWTHGHTHHPFDYKIGKTRILCNPRGYINHEHSADVFKLKNFSVRSK
jgi:predicted phosphodiesterase